MARCPLASTRCSCVCVGLRCSLAFLSSYTGATQPCSAMAGSMNVVVWRGCLWVSCVAGRKAEGWEKHELVSPPWRSSHGELKVHTALVCPTPYGKSPPVSLDVPLAFQGRHIQLLEEMRCFRQHLSHLPPLSPLCCWQPVYPWVASPVSQSDFLIYRPKRGPGVGSLLSKSPSR